MISSQDDLLCRDRYCKGSSFAWSNFCFEKLFFNDRNGGAMRAEQIPYPMQPVAGETAALEVIRVGAMVLDPERRTLKKGAQLIHLTPTEFELVHFLMANAGRPIRHSRLLSKIWGSQYGSRPEYLRTYMCQLRKKLEDDPARPGYLLTNSHFGYRFREGKSSR